MSKFEIDRSPLSQYEIDKAAKELRETPDIVSKELENLRKLVKAEPGLIWDDSDATLTTFLRPSHWYSQSAFELIKGFCDFRSKYSSLLENLDIRIDEKYLKTNVLNVLTERDQDGSRIMVMECGEAWDPDAVSSEEVFRMLYILNIASMAEPKTQVNGVVVIMDYKGLGMKQVRAKDATYAKRLISFVQSALPLRLKAVHIINEPTIYNLVFQVTKPFLNEKLKKRLYFHGDKMEKLHKHISPEHLPVNYGGKLPKIDYGGEQWYPALLSVEQQIRAWEGYGYEKDIKKK